jgi:thymidylate kinase/thymidylate synthase ThyX
MKAEPSEKNGLFLVIEGTDGSGKTTQYNLLKERLKTEGYDVLEIHFPRYEEPSSYFVKEYLKGNYGNADEVGPYTGSLFYALDRYQAGPIIRKALEEGKIVLCDRYVGSNMAHQGTKFLNAEERRGYFIWLDNLEFQMLGIPRPDMNFVLTAPYEIIQDRLKNKLDSSTHVSGKDIHEIDPEHSKRSLEVYIDLCNLFPKDFKQVDALRGSKVLDIREVQKIVWEAVNPLLPEKIKQAKSKVLTADTKKTTMTAENPYIEKTKTGYKITPAGEGFLAESVTSPTDNVYAFNEKLSPITIAAAMARLSRRGDDMRVTILDEFAAAMGKDEKLLQRVITAYGDDSVQQLVGQHVVVEGASNLLTKKLEWGRLAAYLEQSTRYIYFDRKDENGKYKYYTPGHFDSKIKQQYNQTMDQIFDLYSEMVHELTDYVQDHSSIPEEERDIAWKGATRAQACDAIRPVLPVSTKSTVGIYASGQALESLIMHLLSDELSEAKETGQKLLDHARKVIPTFLERADKPERGGATIAYRANTAKAVAKLANKYLPNNHSSNHEAVELVSFWPRNELDLIPDMLYEYSNLSLKEIEKEFNSWPMSRKEKVFKAYMGERLNRRHRPGRALEKAHYNWDLICDYGIFRDLQRHRMVDDLEWQALTPRYGYDIPKLVEEAGLVEQFEKCFDLSLELYAELQTAGYGLEAQYATLLGHKMRWKVTYNAREAFHLHELRTSPQGHPGYRKLVLEMHEKLAEVHPLLAEAMKFVNQGEDAELTRLAAERYTQYKLNQIS